MIKYLIIIIVLISSCSAANEKDIPGHIKILENLTVYSAEEEPVFTIRFEKEQTFPNQENVIIGNPGSIIVDRFDRIYIEEKTWDHATIFVFQPDGELITTIGRQGKGPGEFISLFSLQIRFDRLYLYDAGLQRLTVFSVSEQEKKSFPVVNTVLFDREEWNDVEPIMHFPGPNIVFILSNGYLLGGFIDIESDEKTLSDRKIHVYLFNENGKILHPVQKILEFRAREYLNLHPTIFLYPFLRKSLMAISDTDYIYTAWTEDFLIKVHAPDGTYQRSIYYPVKKRPLGGADDILLKYLKDREEAAKEDPRLLHSHRERVRLLSEVMPETWPALNEMLIDDENRIWVSTIVDDSDVYEWWVLEGSGELVAKFRWPRYKEIIIVKNNKIYTRETDEEFGLQRVVRYDLKIN